MTAHVNVRNLSPLRVRERGEGACRNWRYRRARHTQRHSGARLLALPRFADLCHSGFNKTKAEGGWACLT
ncbi:hypothetical protein BJ122_10828 [Rhodopseudomonas faecalis]|uniref:Uncharacterized protein n=1 Tax=Rhodopseudomonas faecalis TaxID=99655 RepID=A0A318TEX5_9BRAD|nr:hypothetical protein [Rhodopseudomonas faecalis]PYF03103.1 hypothetical protein BJ122_10828 [Rhodopseudomonas faecalis]